MGKDTHLMLEDDVQLLKIRIAQLEGLIAHEITIEKDRPAWAKGHTASKARLELMRLEKRRLEAFVAEKESAVMARPLIPWKSTAADFAALVSALFEKGYIQAASLSDALRICASHFAGVSQDERSLLQGLTNRGYSGAKSRERDFHSIPDAAKPRGKGKNPPQ